MKRKVLVNKLQLIDALGTLNISENGQVDIHDVLGVINCCESWLTDLSITAISPIISKSQQRRIEIQLADSKN